MTRFRPLILAALLCGLSQPTYAADATYLEVSRVGDTELSCGQLSQEGVLMRDIIATTEDIKEGSDQRNMSITAAGALGSFLVSSVTGGIGIVAAGYLLKHSGEEKREEADNIQDIAEQRRSLMVGIYNARGCHGPIEHVFNSYELGDDMLASGSRIASIEPAAGEEMQSDRHERRPRYNN